MFSCRTKMTNKVSDELLKPLQIAAICLTAIGGAGVFIDIAILLVFGIESDLITIIFAVFLGVVVMYFVLVSAAKKNNGKFIGDETEYVFYDTYFTIKTIRKDEVVSDGKMYYRDVPKVKETKSYIFIYLNNQNALAVGKADLASGDLDLLRAIFKMPTKKA